jgi:cyclopentanol dehydrogenase
MKHTLKAQRLVGKVAIVTGGASGIGEATAMLFARHGAKVVIADLSEERAGEVAKRIGQEGGTALAFRTDVTHEGNIIELVNLARREFGRIDVLVNSAGIALSKPEVETSQEEWNTVMAINATGTFLASKHVISHMKEGGGGSIVNIASVAANVGWAGFGAYCASKGAVRAFTKATAVAHGREGIRANSVHPGVTETPMTAASIAASVGRYEGSTQIGRFGQPIDIANCCLFLASDESSYVTGSELIVDGGTLAV